MRGGVLQMLALACAVGCHDAPEVAEERPRAVDWLCDGIGAAVFLTSHSLVARDYSYEHGQFDEAVGIAWASARFCVPTPETCRARLQRLREATDRDTMVSEATRINRAFSYGKACEPPEELGPIYRYRP